MNSFSVFTGLLIVFQLRLLTASTVLKYSINEKQPINTFIADLSEQFQIRSFTSYSFVELLPINAHLFSVDKKTGHLKTSAILDREQLCHRRQCSCDSCILVYHLSVHTFPRVLEKIIEIRIDDQNDHSPAFEQQQHSMRHEIHIKDDVPLGHRIVLPSAHDPDEGPNGVQIYRLNGSGSEDFDIDYSSNMVPYLVVRTSLDRQRSSLYSLKLIAYDRFEKRSATISLDIRITNQSIPNFQQSVYTVDIREDLSIGSSILRVEAISDRGQMIFYELLTESPFIIDRITGQIQLRKLLDYERESSFRLTIKAFENSVPTYAIVLIRVIDVNDNAVSIFVRPQGNTTTRKIRHDQHVISIAEDIPVGTTVAHVFLNDLDSFGNGNPYLQIITNQPPSPFSYKLIYQNQFQNTKVYSLILNIPLDRETKSLYEHIQLLAYDSGTPSLQSRLSIALEVIDVNDCIPRIVSDTTTYNVNENNPLGLILGKLKGYDEDLNLNGKFEYRVLNQTDLLTIDSNTGQLVLNQSIDFEQYSSDKYQTIIDLDFWIEIRDLGQPSLASQTKITVRLHDLNDNSPVFDRNQSSRWTFHKSFLQKDAIIGRIQASDLDSGLYGLVRYAIQSSDPCFRVDITSLGYVYLLEQVLCSSSTYDFEVTVSDFGSPNPRSTTKIFSMTIDSNSSIKNVLPRRISSTIRRIQLDVEAIKNMAFLIDITNNNSINPRIVLNNTDLPAVWELSSTGEVRLVSQPNFQSYFLIFYIVDDFNKDSRLIKLQVDLCNSTKIIACRSSFEIFNDDEDEKTNQLLVFWAISLALIITTLSIILISLFTCLCCRKPSMKKPCSTTNSTNFFQRTDLSQAEKTVQTCASSTIPDEDHDSACVVNTNSSFESQVHKKETNSDIYQPSTYFYDLKLAELMRQNQHPPCVHLHSQLCQSSSTDYGFMSSEPSSSYTSTSTLTMQEKRDYLYPTDTGAWTINQESLSSHETHPTKNSFVSSCEFIV